jgi:hypothetical protein
LCQRSDADDNEIATDVDSRFHMTMRQLLGGLARSITRSGKRISGSNVAEAAPDDLVDPDLTGTIQAIDRTHPRSDRPDTTTNVRRPVGAAATLAHTADDSGVRRRASNIQIIYHVGGRGTPTETSLITNDLLKHLRDLCAQLLRDMDGPRVIRIASTPDNRYAKSLVAVQLASLLSRANVGNILALEGDLEHPRLGDALGFCAPRGYGLAEQVGALAASGTAGKLSIGRLDAALHVLVNSSQYGSHADGGHQSASAALIPAIIARLRREMSFVIVDGPAVGAGADSHYVDAADGVVFVAQRGVKLADTLAHIDTQIPQKLLLRIVEAG